MNRRIAIIGSALRLPGTTPEAFWDDLLAGRDLITETPRARWARLPYAHPDPRQPGASYSFAAGTVGDVSGFDAEFFGISPREAAQMDPQQRMMLELAWEAFEDAGIPPEAARGRRCGVFTGVASLDYSYRIARDPAGIDVTTATGNTSSIVANRISHQLDLRGPSLSLDTACSSSLVAFHQACQAISAGDAELALAGGVSLHLHPLGFILFAKASMLSATGSCTPFDQHADGYVRSEGGGLFLLKGLEAAVADGDPIHAVVAGTAVNTDGATPGLTVPSAEAQAGLMRDAYAAAGIEPDEIAYLEAHGTGTAVGDPIECRAIGEALGQHRAHPLPFGSVKSNLGHMETAAGVASLAKAIGALADGRVPATIGIEQHQQAIDLEGWNLEPVTATRSLPEAGRNVIGINGFGFGGANAHVILEAPPAPPAPDADGDASHGVPLLISANDPQARAAMAGDLAARLAAGEDLYRLAYHQLYRRSRLQHGAAGFFSDAVAARDALATFAAGGDTLTTAERLPGGAAGLAFVYTGNGCQWAGMGRELLDRDPDFTETVAAIDRDFEPLAGFSLAAEIRGDNGAGRLERTEIAQPVLFAVQAGITAVLRRRGVEPTAVTGHSVGEVAAAWASGALSLADATRVIYARSHHQARTRGSGAMLAAAMDPDTAAARLADPRFSDLHLAVINARSSVTIAGPTDQLDLLEAELAAERVPARGLGLDYAFHTPAMDGIRDGLLEDLAGITPRQPVLTLVSTVTGAAMGAETDAAYWWRNVREPVRFDRAVAALADAGVAVFVEIGGHPILKRHIEDGLGELQRSGRAVATLHREGDARRDLARCNAELLLTAPSPAGDYWFPAGAAPIRPPRYPWQRGRHWLEETGDAHGPLNAAEDGELLGYRVGDQPPTWESPIDTRRLPWLADHRVGDATVFPATGFVALALAAARHDRDAECLALEGVTFEEPLLLDARQGRLVRTRLAEGGHIAISAREAGAQGPWQTHARARLLAETSARDLAGTAPALPDRPPDFKRGGHLAAAQGLGLAYGPAFQALAYGWLHGSEALGVLEPTDGGASGLDPRLVDSALQLFLPLMAQASGRRPDTAYLPVRVARLQCRDTGQPPRLARLRSRRWSPHSISADLDLYDAEGRQLAALREVRLQAARLRADAAPPIRRLNEYLVAAPRRASAGEAVRAADGGRLISGLAEAAHATGATRYAAEVDPLLDRLAEAFASEGLGELLGAEAADAAATGDSASGHPDGQERLARTRRLAEAAGALTVLEDGSWRLDAAEHVPARTIWQLLIRDYPDYAGLALRVGRYGRHLPALIADPEAAPLDPASLLDGINRELVSHRAREALAERAARELGAWQTALEPGERLRVAEAGPDGPWLGEAAARQWAPERCSYRYLWAGDAAQQAGQRLQAHWPAVALTPRDAPIEANDEPADVGILAVDSADHAATEAQLAALRSRLAPGAAILVLGVRPGRWLAWLAAPRQPCGPEAVRRLLADASVSEADLAGDSQAGAYALWARLPEGHAAEQGPDRTPRDCLIATEPAGRAMAEALARALEGAGHRARLCTRDDPPDDGPASFDHIVEVAIEEAGASVVDGATRWSDHLRARANAAETADPVGVAATPPTLWVVTTGAAAAMGGGAATVPGIGAAIWGFARTLANEVRACSVRLVDIPAPAAGTGPAAVADALAAEISAPDAETELVLGPGGERYAPRLDDVPETGSSRAAHTLTSELPGQLGHLAWREHHLPEPGPHQLAVRVHATGLNFRDVMYALGLLADEALEDGFADASLGLEFVGTVEAMGAEVQDLAAGDTVVGFGPASFSDRLISDAHTVARVPAGVSEEAAATIPTAFFTAYYALHHLARLEPGERVLIHGAAGGVGIAAVQIAQWLGAEIYATVGSPAKADFLRLLGLERLYDSRGLTFAEDILHDTPDGRGVDVVLNVLAGEAINQNLRVLNPGGRFLELGKRDFYEDTHIGLRPFRDNLSYFGIDSDQLLALKPALSRRLFQAVMAGLESGDLHPLPYTAFAARDVVPAFRHMQQARQIGKVVVTQPPAAPAYEDGAATGETPVFACDPAGSYLVTGGLRGFGLRTAEWLAERGARRLVLAGRSGVPEDEARQRIQALEARGVTVTPYACDIADRDAVAGLLAYCREHGPLRGLVHAAAVIDDGLARDLDAERIRSVLAPKLAGARHLHELTDTDALDCFVLYSSATTAFGNPGQASYVAANRWLEALAAHRRARGQPAVCLRWGAIGDAGFLARNETTRKALESRMGGTALSADEALARLGHYLAGDGGLSEALLRLDWHALARTLPGAGAPRLGLLAQRAGEAVGEGESDATIRALAERGDTEGLREALMDLLRSELAGILQMEQAAIDAERPFQAMGLDSLMGVELLTAIEARTEVRVPVMALSEASNLAKLTDYLIAELTGEGEAHADDEALLASMAAKHGAEEALDESGEEAADGS